jgi:hypothetical protein
MDVSATITNTYNQYLWRGSYAWHQGLSGIIVQATSEVDKDGYLWRKYG